MSIAQTLESIPYLAEFSESVLAYPIVLSIHLTCIALFGGMILATDLRLLGLTFKSLTITEVVTSLRPWKRVGGTIMICMGLLLATSEATKYAPNPYFWTKMVTLGLIGVHALIFRPLVYNRTKSWTNPPPFQRKRKLRRSSRWSFGPPCSPWDE